VTAKRDSKTKPKKDKRPKIKKETLNDLEPKDDGAKVKGAGRVALTDGVCSL
jgi:hypothetical protein